MSYNVFVLLLDTAKAKHLSCYGYDRQTTPFLEELAAESITYDQAFAPSIYSLPSYASIFTGQYPSEHGAVNWERKIERNTLVEGLNEQGYHTHSVSTHLVSGQFGIGDAFDDLDKVFVEQRDQPFDDDPVVARLEEKAHKKGWDSELSKYMTFCKYLVEERSPKSALNGVHLLRNKAREYLGWWTDNGAAAAVDTSIEAISDASRPFFLFTNFIEPHDPYKPPKRFIRKFMPDNITMSEIRQTLDYSSRLATFDQQEISEREREILVNLYDAELAYVDTKIKELYQRLQEIGELEETIFVVTSDHGDVFGKEGYWGHLGKIFNELTHVPLIIRHPDEPTRRIESPVEIRSLHDQILSVTEDDRSWSLPTGEALFEYHGIDSDPTYHPWDLYEHVDEANWKRYQAGLVRGGYKLIWDSNDEVELFDMQKDFYETEDITSENSNVISRLRRRVEELVGRPETIHREYRAEMEKNIGTSQTPDKEVQEMLADLGYLE